MHDLFPLEHPEWHSAREIWTYRRSFDQLRRREARFVVPSEWVAERVVAQLDIETSLVQVVPLGVSGVFASRRSEGELAGVCARFGVQPGSMWSAWRVSTRKNVITIVRAAAELAEPQADVMMIGPDGPGAAEVDAEIAGLDGRARVVRTGYLPDQETAALVQAAGVLVHPALGEGFGFVPLEAMAAGTPVIAARVSAVPEVTGEAALPGRQPHGPVSVGAGH